MSWNSTVTRDTTIGSGGSGRARWGERAEHIRLLHDRYPDMPQSVIARKTGATSSNVSEILKRYTRNVTVEQLREFQANRADVLDAICAGSLASITPEHLSNSSALQLMTIAGIAYDKARLERGQATSINMTALVDVANMLRQQRGVDPSAITIDGGSPEVG